METSLKIFVFIAMFIFLIFLMAWNELLPNPWKDKAKYYDVPFYIVTGPLDDLGYIFYISFVNATALPIQKSAELTEVFFGKDVLRIFHVPLKFEFVPTSNSNLKLKVLDLGSILEAPVHFGVLTEDDGLPKNMELRYQNLQSLPIIETNGTEILITLLHQGFTRVITIDSERKINIGYDLVEFITITDLTLN